MLDCGLPGIAAVCSVAHLVVWKDNNGIEEGGGEEDSVDPSAG